MLLLLQCGPGMIFIAAVFYEFCANRTLPMTVYYFYGENASQWNLVFADMMIVSIPIVILYLFCQKYIVSGMTAGAVKG